jgi:arylformamidase
LEGFCGPPGWRILEWFDSEAERIPMRFYDATLPLREGMVAFPGDPPFGMAPVFRRSEGDPFDLALLSLGTHAGTHVDPPAHYLDGGATVDQLSMDSLVGPGVVLDMRGRERIDRAALEGTSLYDRERVLFKTDSGPLLMTSAFQEEYVHLTEDGALYLVEKGVKLVGIDYLSVDAYNRPDAPVHRTLLRAGIVILEGLHLLEVPPGAYQIFCLPLRLAGGDGAPARVVLREE